MNLVMIAVSLLSVFFLFASSIKIAGWQKTIFETQLEMFRNYGLNRQIMAVVGVVEVFGAIAIWFQGSFLGTLGALAILGTSTGAIFFHLVYDTWKDGLPAMITWALSAFVAWQGRDALLSHIS